MEIMLAVFAAVILPIFAYYIAVRFFDRTHKELAVAIPPVSVYPAVQGITPAVGVLHYVHKGHRHAAARRARSAAQSRILQRNASILRLRTSWSAAQSRILQRNAGLTLREWNNE